MKAIESTGTAGLGRGRRRVTGSVHVPRNRPAANSSSFTSLRQSPNTVLGRAPVVALVESFTGGLGTAAFLAFLMHVCEREHAATQYALLSALFGLTRSIAGAVSGVGASRLGYAPYFAATFALALPAYALLPWLQPWIHDRPSRSARRQSL